MNAFVEAMGSVAGQVGLAQTETGSLVCELPSVGFGRSSYSKRPFCSHCKP